MRNDGEQLLVVNPGSTSTKVAVFRGEQQIAGETLRHDVEVLRQYTRIWDQYQFRLQSVRLWARARVENPDAIVSNGGLFRPMPGGTYAVNDRMLEDARNNRQGEHAANLGCAIAHQLASEFECRAFVVDPVSVDEFEPLARYSGHPLMQRSSLSHALSIHAAAYRAARELGRSLGDTGLVIAHLGGGISVAPVRGGRIVDVNDAASGGPFSPERTGTLPLQQFITLCFSGSLSEREVRSLVMGKGGLVAYLGTNSAEVVEERIGEGDAFAREIYEAMAYQIAKEIGSMAAVLSGAVDAIVLTGGLASSSTLVPWVTERVRFIAPVLVYPGEDELKALALAALRVLRAEEKLLEY
ncbi:MAG: butyrate kinase [Ignavibacteria bacterium]|nr:butyrate kinase [Ignavibacteria bacterium]